MFSPRKKRQTGRRGNRDTIVNNEPSANEFKPEELARTYSEIGLSHGLGTIARITGYALRTPWLVAIALASTIIAASLQLLIPVLLGQAIDQTQQLLNATSISGKATAPVEARAGLWTTAWMVLAVWVLRGIFTTAQNYFAESVGHHTGYLLRLAYYEKIQSLNFGFHDRVHSGDLITAGMLDVEGVRVFFSTGLVRVVLLSVLIGVGGYLLLSTDIVLGIMALSFVPFVAWQSSSARLRLRSTWLQLQERLSDLGKVMEENLSGIRVVRAFAGQNHEIAKFASTSARALSLAQERVQIRVKSSSTMTLSFFIAMGLVLWFGGNKVINDEISVGTLASFLTFMTILQMPVRQLGLLVNSIARASTCGARVFKLLDLEPEVADAPDATPLKLTEGLLRFDAVDFNYPGVSNRPVLSDISFEAHRGQTIGIMGPPGSGKTTIAQLIPRFYDVSSGSITLDGQDIRSITLQSLRRAVAVVQQESFLFTTSLENNIAYGDPWARDIRIERASESAQLHRYIMDLPDGYHTVVGERGASLSGGQQQRMSIARTLLLQPAVLVFDDSTAAVDATTERRIREEIQTGAKDRVTIIVAHRLSSLMHADKILFIDGGRIVESGSHEELLALGGRYHALYELQVNPSPFTEQS
ncbi:multidrug ABC transporter [Chromatiales bacterium (ex Bugula neritina AB1)]|nr:multidrug ABC transporter [Chromatiales bacterium (ex Bugula neritina AB1)]